eukprot:gene14477-30821_t
MAGLSRTLVTASAVAAITCFIVHGCFQFDRIYSVQPICNGPSVLSWVWYSKGCSTVAFLSNGGLLLCHRILNNIPNGIEFGVTMASITVMLIAGISGLLEIQLEWGGYCNDPFGVTTSATQSGEWVSSVPLIIYTVICFDHKKRLSRKDVVIILLSIIAMLCTLFLQISNAYWLGVIFLLLGLVTGGICIFLLINESTELTYAIIPSDRMDDSANRKANQIRHRLRRLLLICLPSFPILYFLG